jgi:MraZ protein
MFRGRFEHTLDSKGRLSIPAKFREVLLGKADDRIVISNFVYTDSRCLDVYPYDEWLRFEEQLKTKPKFERHMLLFQNYYLANASECSVDKQGRILIPPHLRNYASLKKDVVMVGAVEKFRIWDKEAYKKVFIEAEEKLMQDPDFLNELGL